MFEKIRFAILCVTSGLAMAAAAETPGGDLSARLYFNFEGQEFSLSVAGDRVEALTIHHGRVQRRGVGKVSPDFSAALKTLQDMRPRVAPREVAGREVIANERFYYIALSDGALSSASKTSSPEIERLLTTARQLAAKLPQAELSGLYLLALPASKIEKGDTVIDRKTLPPSSPILAALTAPAFPIRVTDAQTIAKLPRDTLVSISGQGSTGSLLVYWEGAPFSIADWLAK